MEAYRDQYATLFKGGRGVVVLGVSVDADTTQQNWMREKDFPFVFASDIDGKVGQAYGAFNTQYKMENRALYVIGPDGKIAYKTPNFRVLAQDAYTELGAVVDKLSPTPGGDGPKP
jgi:peroxiredoxin Q/BCP